MNISLVEITAALKKSLNILRDNYNDRIHINQGKMGELYVGRIVLAIKIQLENVVPRKFRY